MKPNGGKLVENTGFHQNKKVFIWFLLNNSRSTWNIFPKKRTLALLVIVIYIIRYNNKICILS